ncbi:hypothetical protein [Bacillus sp. C28GYM-DRY-1]|uniref:hypothetical protein n=1 Tax=Bacillus sp. C28GYM-DRY-1 TaxID=3062686 RepID=UPI0026747162|nr:hypothetical protein [Bacillus sp. C28GYM-DRY-1]MDO3659840.1 hypothetical protein [Bacillus sp. C28GYM-DRY-1]
MKAAGECKVKKVFESSAAVYGSPDYQPVDTPVIKQIQTHPAPTAYEAYSGELFKAGLCSVWNRV